jgi:branched-chain amino acid transport system substrate-binding protein
VPPTAHTTAARIALGALLAAACLSGCGGGARAAQRRAAQAATGTTPSSLPTPAPIRVGSICSCSGPGAASLAAAGRALRGWARSVNAAGGIDGHPLQLIELDDGSRAARGRSDARALVAVDRVVAIVGQASLEVGAWLPYAVAAKVPVIGGLALPAGVAGGPDFFPSASPLLSQVVGAASLAKGAGVRRLALLSCPSASCARLVRIAEGAAALFDLKVQAVISPSASPARRRRSCRSLLAGGVNGLFLTSEQDGELALVKTCSRMHITPQLLGLAAPASPRALSDPALAGMLLSAPTADPLEPANGPRAAVAAALRRFAPGTALSYPVLEAWTGGLLFAAAAEAGGVGRGATAATAAQVTRGLYSLSATTLGGLSPPLRFRPGSAALVPCWFAAQLQAGELAAMHADRPSCVSTTQAAALAKALS